MRASRAASVILACATAVAAGDWLHPLSDEFIQHINRRQSGWTAGRNFRRDTPLAHIKTLMGVIDDGTITRPSKRTHDDDTIERLPDSFDPREKWPHCPSLNEITDQGACGSCWAHGAVQTMTDRYCISSNGTKQFHFSAEDLLSCCYTCGPGCTGGKSAEAFKYWEQFGIVSGGNYNSGEGCRPYSIFPCEHYTSGNRPHCIGILPTPKCYKKCIDGYNVSYEQNKRYAKKVYSVLGEEQIKTELFKNGPVEASFEVYTDFLHYKSGVYKYTGGKRVGGHAVKMMGWGEEEGQKYWLVANSWNSDWGNKGFFKILRGNNHCGIEATIVTGEPRVD